MEITNKIIKYLKNLRSTQTSPNLRIPQGVQAEASFSSSRIKVPGLLTSFGIIALLSGVFFSNSAYAAYSTSISRASSGTVSLGPIKPSYSGTLGTGSDVVTVTSNCTAGYSLYVSATSGGSTNLSMDGGTDYIPSTTTATGSEATLTKDTWGIGKNSSKFSKLPAYSANASSLTPLYTGTGDSSSTAKNYTVYYGVNVSTDKTPGTYTGDVLYTVVMNSACEKWTLKFDDNGATTNNLSSQEVASDATINLADISSTDKIARTGYTLTGWKDQDGNSYGITGTADVNPNDAATVTLTAQWKINSRTVTIKNGSGVTRTTASDGTNTKTNAKLTADYDKTITIAATAFSTGYHFSGWTVTSGGVTLYSNSAMATKSTKKTPAYFKMPDSNVNITANAAANTYTINFNGQGGDVESRSIQGAYYTENIRTPEASYSGYNLVGWSHTAYTAGEGTADYATTSTDSFSVSTLASGANVADTDGATIELYAVWAANTYNFSWNGNGGTTSGGGTSGTYGGDVTTATATRSGYIFLGWAHSSTATAKTYDGNTSTAVATIASGAGVTGTNGATITLYAVWEAAGPAECSDTVHPTPTTGCKMKDDNIWILGNYANTATWNDLCSANNKCSSSKYCLSGYTLPTKDIYDYLLFAQGSDSQLYSALGLESLVGYTVAYFWSTTEKNANYAYTLSVASASAKIYEGRSKTGKGSNYVLCYKKS